MSAEAYCPNRIRVRAEQILEENLHRQFRSMCKRVKDAGDYWRRREMNRIKRSRYR